ncbi:MAG: hypothetical protein QOF44_3716 [Streptomyces sp.]|nr:hypothetical protein [Streptomyces sp.]
MAPMSKPDAPWRDRILAVPVLTVAAVVCFGATVAMSNAHVHRQSAACRWMSVPWTNFAVAYGALVAAGLALLVHFGLFRTARRKGWNPLGTWDGRLSVACAVAAGVMVLVAVGGVFITHSQAAESADNLGRPMCEGAAAPF